MHASAAGGPRIAAALSTLPDLNAALDQALERIAWTGPVDLALVFASHDHRQAFDRLGPRLSERLAPRHLLGCTGESIVGGAEEIEGQPALALWLAHLPHTELTALHLQYQRTPEGGSFTGWPDDWWQKAGPDATLLLLGEPYSFPADALLERLNDDQPGLRVVGGMASGGHAPGENRLLLGGQTLDRGAVALLLGGGVRVHSVVSQGCRPIGVPMVVTQARENIIQQLGGQTPLEQLRAIWPSLNPRERQLVQTSLHVGQAIDERQERFGRGDFLIRNVIGADSESGALAVGDFVRPGRTVQFHIRDAQSAREDLAALLAAQTAAHPAPPAGGLLFTCNGRGSRLFSQPHHDAAAVSAALRALPLAGFFAQGEIGPVAGKNFLHGYTASVVLFEAP
jgi:small ligand-binding sensory domain FIST